MRYKTMVLELIQERPELTAKLRLEKTMLKAVETYALELKASHEAWKERLQASNQGNSTEQIEAEALELALQELQDRLPSASIPNDEEVLSLDAAMAFLRGATPNA